MITSTVRQYEATTTVRYGTVRYSRALATRKITLMTHTSTRTVARVQYCLSPTCLSLSQRRYYTCTIYSRLPYLSSDGPTPWGRDQAWAGGPSSVQRTSSIGANKGTALPACAAPAGAPQ